jgi:hypothetical protein
MLAITSSIFLNEAHSWWIPAVTSGPVGKEGAVRISKSDE